MNDLNLSVVTSAHDAVLTAKEASKSSDIDQYVRQFRELSFKTSEAIIDMGMVVCLARSNLVANGQFEQFCKAIGYGSKSSSIRKFEQIGKQADLLIKHAGKLPNNWTSLYILVQLGDQALEDLLDADEISSDMTGAEIKQLVVKHNPPKVSANKSSTKKYRYKCGVTFDEPLAPADQLELDDLIANFIKSKGKAYHVATVHAVCSKNTDPEISAEPLAA